ncbi:MAG: hypothetical protein K8F91_20705 [Candidatus Obscuribacterales bacterium]|nr:hypothetical protein [Candidatus Obscuribacterales bacterium]
MSKNAVHRVAEEAARLMIDGIETEYLQAKERAVLMLGLSSQTRLPSNRKVRECIAQLTRLSLGADEVERRLNLMREIACRIMAVIDDYDPHLIGSTLSGDIRDNSDVDLHAYCDEHDLLVELLFDEGFESVETEVVENQKGSFTHLRWMEENIPVEITVYPWSWKEITLYSSVTNKPMKRASFGQVQALLKRNSQTSQ